MPKINELYQLMPGKDCGICGSITCRQFARRLAAGEEKPENCQYLDAEGREKTEKLLKEGVETHRKPPPKNEIITIQPCQHNPKRVMTESRIGDETRYGVMDTHEMCKLARKCHLFKNEKHSEKLGITTFQYENTEIVLYNNGKISIKQADSREEAIKAIDTADEIFHASYICPRCGGSAIDCAKGFCKCNMECEILPKEGGKKEIGLEKNGAEEIESAGIKMLTENPRTGILLVALAECKETLEKTGKEETERIKNNQECIEKIKKALKQL